MGLLLSWPPMRNSEAFALGSAHLRLSMWLLDFSSHDCSDVRWLRSLRVYASALAYMKVKESVIVWGSMDVCMCTVAGCLLMCGSCALLVGPNTRFCNCSSCDQIGCGIVHLAGMTARVFPSFHLSPSLAIPACYIRSMLGAMLRSSNMSCINSNKYSRCGSRRLSTANPVEGSPFEPALAFSWKREIVEMPHVCR